MPTPKGTKNPNMARFKGENGRWKGGKSSDFRRRITNAKKGELVHHKDGRKSNNAKSNLRKVKGTGAHNKLHPEKGRKK